MDDKLISELTLIIAKRAQELMIQDAQFDEGVANILFSLCWVLATGVASIAKTGKMDREQYIVFVDKIIKTFRKNAIKLYEPEVL